MNLEELRNYCLAKKNVEESFPFDDTTLVFKLAGKIFAILPLDTTSINLKCEPERAIMLRENYPVAIQAGYHMNKKHWNTIYYQELLEKKLIYDLIDHSYDLIYNALPKKIKIELCL